jgi:Transposase DDE domain
LRHHDFVKTTKSPAAVLAVAHLIGESVLAEFSHRFSPKKFTQPQLFACLVLKEFLQLDYRKLAALLDDASDLCDLIELKSVPHFTTFQKAAPRLLQFDRARRLLRSSLHWARFTGHIGARISLAALDGTGFETRQASDYYLERRRKTSESRDPRRSARYPKAGIVCDTNSHFILAVVPDQGPGSDQRHYREAVDQACANVAIDTMAADAGYDSEASHAYARIVHRMRTLIPPTIGRPTAKPPTGYWRRQMKSRLHLTRYTQRWQVETVNSMLKRLLGSALRARQYWSRCRELFLRALTLNTMLLAEPP